MPLELVQGGGEQPVRSLPCPMQGIHVVACRAVVHALLVWCARSQPAPTVKKPVVSETYEEIVIQGAPPNAWARAEEAATSEGLKENEQYRNAQYFLDFEPQHEVNVISVGRHKVAQHTRILAAKLDDLEAKVKAEVLVFTLLLSGRVSLKAWVMARTWTWNPCFK